MLEKQRNRLYLVLFVFTQVIKPTVFDNRFIPLYDRQWLAINGLPSFFSVDVFFVTGSSAYSENEEQIGLPEIFGQFDQGQFSNALDLLKKENPLRTDWRGVKIPWRTQGKIQGQGIECAWYQTVKKFANRVQVGVGADWLFMRSSSAMQFLLPNDTASKDRVDLKLGPSDFSELDEERRAMFRVVGIEQDFAHQAGFGDVDGYLRIGRIWKHIMKCRKIDAAFRLGCLFPSGVSHQPNIPASIPYGGNGHWGLYGQLESMFEVKEDIKIGCLLRFGKRFARTHYNRMPVYNEPIIFGAETGQLRVNPGVTFNAAPFFVLENLAEGLGASVRYVLTIHADDVYTDRRSCDQAVPVKLAQAEDLSGWASSYFTVNAFYDFGKTKAQRSFDPVISLQWEVPSQMFIPKRVAQTHKVALMLTCYY